VKLTERIRFDRNELAGSFGDIGTDLPLIVGMILASDLNSASVFIMFGLAQVASGIIYGLPMPMQPLKAMAVIVIAQELSGDVLFGGGLAIAIIMLVLSLTGALGWLAWIIPRCVVRGVQFGLGLSLASLALGQYVPAHGVEGYVLAAIGFALMIVLRTNRKVPAGLVVIAVGIVYAFVMRLEPLTIVEGAGLALPEFHQPSMTNILTGLWILALPQLPLSLSNSIIATRQTIGDLFPQRSVTIKRIGITYSIANVVMPWFSGIPVCHGCGGLAGHYALGGRTGGSVVIYGSLYLIIGLFFSDAFSELVQVFPKPILGVVLMFEALTLLLFMQDQMQSRRDLTIALLVAMMAFTLPQGYVVGLLIGTALFYVAAKWRVGLEKTPKQQ